ncbi:AEC family transporter [Geomicrobium sp. JCM 19039]|uniref:AEC family transporter n=1 Tax=Geomicrobium sp. JCM 19039 TaxID=1460636 RepID=UPI00045F1426|nr:AEC family transporter [Geomicrobium sp. JCM 19039]GAK12262.1 malate permease [Geomicrobium sp. JCM 19039]
MNAFIVLLEEMLVLYCILIFGWLAQRFKLLPPMSKLVFTRLLLYVTLPCLIVSSMHLSFEYERVYAVITLIVMSFLFLSITLLYGRWLSKAMQLPDYRSGVFKNLLLFGNQGFIGVAVVFQLFGHEGMFLAAVFNLIYFILIWTYGIAVMNAPTHQYGRIQDLLRQSSD